MFQIILKKILSSRSLFCIINSPKLHNSIPKILVSFRKSPISELQNKLTICLPPTTRRRFPTRNATLNHGQATSGSVYNFSLVFEGLSRSAVSRGLAYGPVAMQICPTTKKYDSAGLPRMIIQSRLPRDAGASSKEHA